MQQAGSQTLSRGLEILELLAERGTGIQSLLDDDAWAALGHSESQRAEVARTRETGWATSADEVIEGITSIAAPIDLRHGPRCAIAVVTVGTPDASSIGPVLAAAAAAIAAEAH